MTRRPATTGYTLVELLAVIAILGVTMGLVMPALQQSRAAARRAACQSNLRQWVFAVQYYAAAHKGRLPRRGQGPVPGPALNRPEDWFNALPPYFDDEPYVELVNRRRQPQPGTNCVWICPEAEQLDRPGERVFFNYAMNMALSVWFSPQPDHIDRVGPLQTMVFMTDSLGPYCSVFPSAKDYRPIERHGLTANVAFLDGHVAALAAEQLADARDDSAHPAVRWFPPNSQWPGPPQ